MKQISKRLSGIFLAMIMVVTMIPLGAFTASATGATVQSEYATGDIITFGSYPQTKVTDSGLITALNTQTLQGDSTVTYGGSRYKRVYFTHYTPYSYDYPTTADYSYQDNNGYYINTVYWFKYEQIQWRVLSSTNGELFVMAEKILTIRAYNQVYTNVTWETCTLRSWLNNEFFGEAFNTMEQARIKTSTVVNADYGTTDGGNNTSDKLFLLSYSEVMNPAYGFSSSYSTRDTARWAQGSDFAKCNGLWVQDYGSYFGNSTWLLRSPGYDPSSAGVMSYNGSVFEIYSMVNGELTGTRPAFKLNLTYDIVSSITVNVTANNKDNSGQEPIENATVSLYSKSEWLRNATEVGNGRYVVSLEGLSAEQLADATVSASKVFESGSGINGSERDAVFEKFRDSNGNIIRYKYELHSETIDPNGNWLGEPISKAVGNAMNLTLVQPRLLVNIAVCYLANDEESKSAEYEQAVKDVINETSKMLAQATDGHIMFEKVFLFSTEKRTDFYDTTNKASMADIRIESRVKDDGKLSSNVKIHSNSNLFGFYHSESFPVNSGHLDKFKNLQEEEKNDISGKATFRHIQMGGTTKSNFNILKQKNTYAKELTHELGHYLLNFFDEYLNGSGEGVPWGFSNPRPKIDGAKVYFGLMDNTHKEIEISRDCDYTWVVGDEAPDRLTMQYEKHNQSCETFLSGWLINGVAGRISTGTFLAEYDFAGISRRRSSYPYAALDNSDFISDTSKSTKANNSLEKISSQYGMSLETNEKLALVQTHGNGDIVTINIYPENQIPIMLFMTKSGEESVSEIPLINDGNYYTAIINLNKGELCELKLVANINDNYLYNIFYVERSENSSDGYFYESADGCVYAYTIPQSDTSYSFTANNVELSNGDFRSVNQSTYISADNNVESSKGELYSVASIKDNIDFTSISWFVLKNSVWTELETEISTEENMNIGARCNFSGDGFYVLMAKESAVACLNAVIGVSGTQNTQIDGLVNLAFTDSNPPEDIAYYHIYYSENAFASIEEEDDVSLDIVFPGADGYSLNLYEAGKMAYVGIVAVGTNGAKSPLSAVVPVTAGTADTDADGIPDWYCDKYLLWGMADENRDIANSDDDGDYYTNFEEYQRGSDPKNPYDKNIFVKAGMNTVIDWQNYFIYGFETAPVTLDGLIAKSSAATLQMLPAQGMVNGTGTVINVIVDGLVTETYTIVIYGDVNGDGVIDTADSDTIVDIGNYALPQWDPVTDAAFIKACDLFRDGVIDENDCAVLTDVQNYALTLDQRTGVAD